MVVLVDVFLALAIGVLTSNRRGGGHQLLMFFFCEVVSLVFEFVMLLLMFVSYGEKLMCWCIGKTWDSQVYLSKKIAIPHQLALQAFFSVEIFMLTRTWGYQHVAWLQKESDCSKKGGCWCILQEWNDFQVVSWNSAQGWIACGGVSLSCCRLRCVKDVKIRLVVPVACFFCGAF